MSALTDQLYDDAYYLASHFPTFRDIAKGAPIVARQAMRHATAEPDFTRVYDLAITAITLNILAITLVQPSNRTRYPRSEKLAISLCSIATNLEQLLARLDPELHERASHMSRQFWAQATREESARQAMAS